MIRHSANLPGLGQKMNFAALQERIANLPQELQDQILLQLVHMCLDSGDLYWYISEDLLNKGRQALRGRRKNLLMREMCRDRTLLRQRRLFCRRY